MSIAFVIVVGGAALAAALTGLLQVLLQKRERERRPPTLEDRIATLATNLETASTVVAEIENEISQRRELAEKLREDVERYEQLRQLNEVQVEAIVQTIKGQVVTASRKSMFMNGLITFLVASVFFGIGLMAGRI